MENALKPLKPKPIGAYNPFPHVIAESGIEHVPDCPGCAHTLDIFEFTMRILDRLEAGEVNQ